MKLTNLTRASRELLQMVRRTRKDIEAELRRPREKRERQRSDEELRRMLRMARKHERQAEELCS